EGSGRIGGRREIGETELKTLFESKVDDNEDEEDQGDDNDEIMKTILQGEEYRENDIYNKNDNNNDDEEEEEREREADSEIRFDEKDYDAEYGGKDGDDKERERESKKVPLSPASLVASFLGTSGKNSSS